ncbi:hypothetical protein OU416_06380 [Saccharopolyspora indica]|uniref:hypothetical protein n=1 Tax=Saccharopolyspora indica TaxID=1229659 RepID=UPI0022EB54C0|nr:hypothetical protein [Saccharopolyspora indica]MDA3643674.1 hypothetical protein [Saccharopolyspora indica]
MATVLTGCASADESEHSFADVAAVRQANDGPAGWVPPWLPESTTDIKVKFNLDTNVSIITGKLGGAPLPEQACKPAAETATPKVTADWWPNPLPQSTTYHCGDFFAVADGDQVYAWQG